MLEIKQTTCPKLQLGRVIVLGLEAKPSDGILPGTLLVIQGLTVIQCMYLKDLVCAWCRARHSGVPWGHSTLGTQL